MHCTVHTQDAKDVEMYHFGYTLLVGMWWVV